ncbi:hypothetical protein NMY22_g14862 [Coprinellus aureogranulatus]|nr:hypothetical protein NMY22_g14862 [Coprinellus aureogranulatus]
MRNNHQRRLLRLHKRHNMVQPILREQWLLIRSFDLLVLGGGRQRRLRPPFVQSPPLSTQRSLRRNSHALTRQRSTGPESPPEKRRQTPTERLGASIHCDVPNRGEIRALGTYHTPPYSVPIPSIPPSPPPFSYKAHLSLAVARNTDDCPSLSRASCSFELIASSSLPQAAAENGSLYLHRSPLQTLLPGPANNDRYNRLKPPSRLRRCIPPV